MHLKKKKFEYFKFYRKYVLKKKHMQRLPFDWKNPIGYLMAVALQIQIASVLIQYIETFLTLGFAGLLFIFSLVKDLINDLKRFNKTAKSKKSQLPTVKELLANLICYDINLTELSSTKFIQISN